MMTAIAGGRTMQSPPRGLTPRVIPTHLHGGNKVSFGTPDPRLTREMAAMRKELDEARDQVSLAQHSEVVRSNTLKSCARTL